MTLPMVRTTLHPHPRCVHQMHLRPHRGQYLGPLQDMPPVPGGRHPPDWSPGHTIAQHARWPTQSPASQKLTTILQQTEVHEAVRRGLVPTAVYTLLRTHTDDPKSTAAHMQRTAVTKMATQLTYHTRRYLQHAASLPPTDQAHLLKVLFYQP